MEVFENGSLTFGEHLPFPDTTKLTQAKVHVFLPLTDIRKKSTSSYRSQT